MVIQSEGCRPSSSAIDMTSQYQALGRIVDDNVEALANPKTRDAATEKVKAQVASEARDIQPCEVDGAIERAVIRYNNGFGKKKEAPDGLDGVRPDLKRILGGGINKGVMDAIRPPQHDE